MTRDTLIGRWFRVIELAGAGYRYGAQDIFNRVEAILQPGSFHFLTGPSGAGKTTFLKLCYLALRPTSGEMRVFGQDANLAGRDDVADLRRRIGVVHQECTFLDHLSVRDNIAMPLVVAGRDPKEHREELKDLLAWVDLEDRADALPPELSGGERQRAALARAVILAPDMIIADEPTGNIDWEMGLRVLTLLTELNKMGRTILVATHDMNLIRAARQKVQARVLRLSGGVLTQAGSDL